MVKIRQKYSRLNQERFNSLLVLLAFVLDRPKDWVIAHPDQMLNSENITELENLFSRLMEGSPLAYLIGHWSFYGFDFQINESVLIPRPETELLVEHAILWLRKNHHAKTIIDVGTGSGCIAISIAKAFPRLKIIASDISYQSLRIAQKNSFQHATPNVNLLESDLLDSLNDKVDLICANLPYIPSQKLKLLSVRKHEPRTALDGGKDGLTFIKELLNQATFLLEPKGAMLIEFESTKNNDILHIAKEFFPHKEISIINDLANKPRLLEISST